jgi:transposase
MALYCGIDLHSSNHVIVVIDESDKMLVNKRIANDLETTLRVLTPWRSELVGVAVESTFNWYWLVDGLMEAGFALRLVHTTAVKTYSGLKRSDDVQDAFWLAHLMRLGILPTGYIYPAVERPLRDLMRRRMQLVQQRSGNILSLQNQVWRNTGAKLSCNAIKRLDTSFAADAEPLIRQSLHSSWHVIQALDREIAEIERLIKARVTLRESFRHLLTIPGIGFVLASAIMLETGDITRFAGPGNFASYCRCVDSTHTSNGKKKGEGNRKSGNRYLAWAFVEAAHFARRYCPPAQRFFERKRARTNAAIATKALAHKLARACYFLMRDGVEFDVNKCFA